jgi:hypothetical protein
VLTRRNTKAKLCSNIPSPQARPVEKLSNQDIFDASEFVSKNNATLEYIKLFWPPLAVCKWSWSDAPLTILSQVLSRLQEIGQNETFFSELCVEEAAHWSAVGQ